MKQKRFTSWRQVAEALEASRTGLVRLRQRDDWPVPATMPSDGLTQKQVDAIRSWRESLPRAGQVNSDPGSQDIHRQHRREQTLYMNVRRELLEGKFIERALHEQAMMSLTDTYVRACEHLALTVATTVPDLTPEQRGMVERVMVAQIAAERTRLAALETLPLEPFAPHVADAPCGVSFHRRSGFPANLSPRRA